MKLIIGYFLLALSVPGFSQSPCNNARQYKKFTNITHVSNFIKDCKIQTIDQFLRLLPAKLKRRTTMMYKSGGIGFSSLDFPRIIYHGTGNHLTLTHGTYEKARGYGTIEMAEFDSGKKDFNFKTVSFSSDHGDPQYSPINPQICLQCHRNKKIGKNRLIWHPVPLWPGAYGSMVDKYFYLENQEGPGHSLEYFHSEQDAFYRFVFPKLEKKGLFQYLPRSIYDERTDYYFRSGLRPYFNMSTHTNAANFNALQKLLSKKGISEEQVKYYLLYANSCIKEAKFSSPYTDAEAIQIFEKFIPPRTFKDMSFKLASDYKIQSDDPVQIFKIFRSFLRDKLINNYSQRKKEVCQDLNYIYKEQGENKKVNCENLFDEPFGGHEDSWWPEYYGKNQANHIDIPYYSFFLLFNYLDFPFESWSMDRVEYAGWGTNHNMTLGIQSPLLLGMNFMTTDQEIYRVFENEYKVHDHYKHITDLPSFPLYNKTIEHFRDDLCPNIIAGKSLIFTIFDKI